MDLKGLTAVELGKKIQAKEVTVKEAVEACFCLLYTSGIVRRFEIFR